jgi:hypothetical protein
VDLVEHNSRVAQTCPCVHALALILHEAENGICCGDDSVHLPHANGIESVEAALAFVIIAAQIEHLDVDLGTAGFEPGVQIGLGDVVAEAFRGRSSCGVRDPKLAPRMLATGPQIRCHCLPCAAASPH